MTTIETATEAPTRASRQRKAKGPGKAKNAARAAKAAKRKATGGPTKTSIVRDMLLRPEGVTAKEVLAATGWPAVSMPQQAKAAKLELTTTKDEGQPTRYFGKERADETKVE